MFREREVSRIFVRERRLTYTALPKRERLIYVRGRTRKTKRLERDVAERRYDLEGETESEGWRAEFRVAD